MSSARSSSLGNRQWSVRRRGFALERVSVGREDRGLELVRERLCVGFRPPSDGSGSAGGLMVESWLMIEVSSSDDVGRMYDGVVLGVGCFGSMSMGERDSESIRCSV